MSVDQGFIGALTLTLVLLGAVAVTGRLAKRRLHLPLVALTLLSLGTTIYYAEQLGELYDLEASGFVKPLHLTLAKITTVSYLAPLVTGVWTIRRATALAWHRKAAYSVLVLSVLTLATGTWMILASERLEPAEATGKLTRGRFDQLVAQPGNEEQR